VPSGPLHPDNQQMRKRAAKDIRWKIAAFASAQRALGDDPRIGHRLDRGGDILAAAFANDHEITDASIRQVPHA